MVTRYATLQSITLLTLVLACSALLPEAMAAAAPATAPAPATYRPVASRVVSISADGEAVSLTYLAAGERYVMRTRWAEMTERLGLSHGGTATPLGLLAAASCLGLVGFRLVRFAGRRFT